MGNQAKPKHGGYPHPQEQLDWDGDLNKIAHHMLDWKEKLCSPLGLTEVDVHDIKEIHPNKPELQRYAPTI